MKMDVKQDLSDRNVVNEAICICLTDIAKYKNSDNALIVVANWMRKQVQENLGNPLLTIITVVLQTLDDIPNF